MPIYDHDYYLERKRAIRTLCRDAFTIAKLRRFCDDRSDFEPLLDQFGENLGLNPMVDLVIEHCRVNVLFAELLAGIGEVNPRQYERHFAAIYDEEEKAQPARRAARLAAAPGGGPAGFVDREDELALFRQMVAGEVPHRVLRVVDDAEAGKTYLLMRMFDECEGQAPPLPVVLVDFDERRSGVSGCRGVVREVRRYLGDEGTPAICALLEALEGAAAGDAARREALGRALRDDLAALDRTVLLVDTFERAPEQTCAWLDRWLLEPLRRELDGVLVVAAGRPACLAFFQQPRLWSSLVAGIERLGPLSEDHIRAHYRLRGISVPEAEWGLVLDMARLGPAKMAQMGDLLEQVRGGGR